MNERLTTLYIVSATVGLATGVLVGRLVADHFFSGLSKRSKKKTDSSADLARLMRAMQYSTEKHQFQTRKNSLKTPYIGHPVRVANRLVDAGIKDQNVIVAALLHDTVEDTDATLKEIEDIFGREVAKIVDEVTDDKSLPKHVRKQLQIEHASHISYEAKLVKLADKLDNLQDLLTLTPDGWTRERVGQYFDWAEKVVDGLRGTDTTLELLVDEVLGDKEQAMKIIS